MNCKSGDLALVTCGVIPEAAWANGRIVRCVDCFTEIGFVCWNIEAPLVAPDGAVFTSVYDGVLRPIRDPGDDAVDESKAWLPPVPLPKIDPSLIPEKESV